MFYPAQTSFIPVTVAISSFVEKHGFGGLYPFWYLESTPVKYLTGPVVPSLLIALHRFLGGFSLFDLSLGLIFVAFLFSALGWGLLVWMLSGEKFYGFIVSLLTLLAPWHWISGFALGEVSAILVAALTPWVLLAFARIFNFVKQNFSFQFEKFSFGKAIFNLLLPAVAFAFLLLTNTVASIPAIIGLFILGIVMDKKWEQGLKKAALVILLGWFLTLWWYPPDYWLTLLIAPSIGGKSAAGALIHLVNLLRGFVPVIFAIAVVAWGSRKKDLLQKFALSWFGVFGLLTLFRFFGDPKFWMDWTSWMGEVEVGLVLVIASNFQFKIFNFQSIFKFKFYDSIKVSNFKLRSFSLKNQISKLSIIYLLFTIYILGGWILAWQNRHFWLPRKSIENTVEFKIAKFLNSQVKLDESVFLSGSTAFWLNSFYDISQVRGGMDQVSQDSRWRQATWEIREGESSQKSAKWLEELQIKYLVVHDENSHEYYHDFGNPDKFSQITSLKKIYEQEGDVIYKVE